MYNYTFSHWNRISSAIAFARPIFEDPAVVWVSFFAMAMAVVWSVTIQHNRDIIEELLLK